MGIPKEISNEMLSSLQKVKIEHTGDMYCFARYDPQNGVVYLLDNEGNFTGKTALSKDFVFTPITEASRENTQEQKSQSEERQVPAQEDEDNHEARVTEDNAPPKKKWVGSVLVAIAVIIVVFVAVVLGKASRIVKEKTIEQQPQATVEQAQPEKEENPTDPPKKEVEQAPVDETVPEDTAPETTEAEEQYITVLSIKQPLLPGHILKKADLQKESITEVNYRLLAGVNGLYTEEDMDALLGQVTTEYLPKGSYLSFNNVAAAYAPANPWSRSDEKQALLPLTVMITPETLLHHLWGTEAALKIDAQTKVTTNNIDTATPTESEMPSGIHYSSSIVESMVQDTYEILNVLVVDALDSKGNSLFTQYTALSQVPSGYLGGVLEAEYGTEDKLKQLIPATIVIALNEEKAALITNLKADTISISIQDPIPEVETQIQSETYSRMQNTGTAIVNYWKSIQKE